MHPRARLVDRPSPYSASRLLLRQATKGVVTCIDALEVRRLLAAFTVDPIAPTSGSNFHAISDAVAAAGLTSETDDTIDVVAGAFLENVVINTPLSLRGVKVGQDPRPGHGVDETVVTGQIAITAPGVTVDGFTVLNGDAGASAPTVSAIYIAAAGAVVNNNIVTGSSAGVGLLSTTDATMSQNLVSGFATGLKIVGGGTVTLSNSRLTGNAVGVRVEGANLTATLAHNSISGNTSAGIEVDLATLAGSSAVTLDDNALDNPGVAQVRLLGGESGDLVTFTANAVTLNGAATFLDTVAATPVSGVSSTTFTVIRSTSEDTPINIDLSLDGTALNSTDLTGTQGGVSVAGNVVTFTPAANFNGATSFSFTTAGGATGTVNVAVSAVNDVPTLSGDDAFTVAEGGNYVLTTDDLSASDIDLPAQTITFNVSTVTGGRLELVSNLGVAITSFTQAQLAAGNVRYVHSGDELPSESIAFTATDGIDSTSSQSIAITVTPVNDPPIVTTNASLTLVENGTSPITAALLQATDADNTAAQLVYTVTSLPTHGVLKLNGSTLALNGTFTQADVNAGVVAYVNDGGEATADSFQFTLGDGTATLPAQNFAITVTPVNDAPTASNSSIGTNEDTPASGTLVGNDVDSASLVYAIVDQPLHGSVTITDTATGAFTFTPDGNWHGSTSFTFSISDGSATSNTATVSVTVNAVNDAPAANSIPPVSVDEGQTTTVALNDFFSDVDESDVPPDVLTYSLSGAPSFVSVNPTTGVVTISPGALDSGTYSFTAIATDASNATASTGISLTVVNVVNNPPVIGNLPGSVTIAENAVVPVFDVDATDPDAGQSVTYAILSGNGSGLFTIDANTGVISLTGPLDAETATQYSLVIRVTDNGSPAVEHTDGTLVVNVSDVNDVATSVTLSGPSSTSEGSAVLFTATATDGDVGAVVSYKWFVDNAEQSGQTASTFSITFTDQGSHVVRVEASDRGAIAATDSKSITVSDVAPNVSLSTSVSSVDEAANFSLIIGPITDPGAGDVASIGQVAVWWHDGTFTLINDSSNPDLLATIRAGGTVSVSHAFSDGQNVARDITVSVYDALHTYINNTSILVNNVAPTGSFATITPSVGAGSSAFVNWFSQTDVSLEDRNAGLRYTYVLDVNVPGGDGIYNAGDILIAGDGTYAGSSSLSTLQIPGTLLATAGNYSVLGMLIDKDGSPILTRRTFVDVTASTLQVISLGGDHSGFTVVFNREIDLSVLNLYDGTDVANDTADVVLTRSTGQSIRGSLVINAARNGFDFLVTGGILSQGTYTVRMNSGPNAFKDLLGSALDGDSNGLAGGTYISTFGVNAPPGPVLSTPDFSRGPGQPIDIIPGNTSSDLPISMNAPIAISSINFQLRFDSSLMDVSSVVLGSGMPAGWSVDYTIVTNAVNISLIKTSSGALDIPAGSREIVRLIASVPNNPAIYGKCHVLSFATIVVNGNASIEGTADRSVHKVAFLGDANRDGTINVGDAALIQTVVLGSVTGFDAYPLVDPVIIVDSSRNSAVDSQDATNAALSGFTGSRPADVPAFTPVTVPTTIGADPTYQLPTQLVTAQGGHINVPLNIADDARGIQAGQLRIAYDTDRLDLSSVNIVAGALLASGWQVVTNVNDAQGWVEIGFYSGNAIAGASAVTGTLINIGFDVSPLASDGLVPLTISSPQNTPVSPTILYSRQGAILATTAVSGSLLIDGFAPSVAQASFAYAGTAQSYTVQFSEDVGASISASDFELLNLTTNTLVPLTLSSISPDGRTVTLAFANTGGITDAILKDGDYRLRVRAGQVSDLAGRVNAADIDSTFFFMNSDLNHDRAVNFDDLLVLAQNYGLTSGVTFAQGDVNYDGQVNFDDLLSLAQRYGTSLVRAVPATTKALTKKTRWSDTVIN